MCTRAGSAVVETDRLLGFHLAAGEDRVGAGEDRGLLQRAFLGLGSKWSAFTAPTCGTS